MATATLEIRLLRHRELPKESRLGRMYAQTERVSEEAAPIHSKAQELARELGETENFLADATWEITSVEDFSLALARQILLKRAAEKARLKSNAAAAELDSAQSNFRIEYANYSRAVDFLASGRNQWGDLLLAVERDELMRKVDEWVGE